MLSHIEGEKTGKSNLILSEEVKDKITTFIEYQKTFSLFMKYPQLLKRPSDNLDPGLSLLHNY